MTGHHKFSQLTKDFSEERQAKIKQKTAYLKTKITPRVGLLLEQLDLESGELIES